MQQLSAAVTAAALMTGSVFPNVTLSYFEVTGGYADGMGGIMGAAFAPLIKHEERIEWEEYAVLNQGWLTESARLKIVHPGHRDALHGTIQDHEHDRRLLNQGWLAESARLKKPHPEHGDALHGTIQDHEHDRRLQSPAPPPPSIPSRIYRWENGTQVIETSRPGQLLAPLWQLAPASAPAVNGTY
jgi:hypothetical protein